MADLAVDVGPIQLKNPILTASGTFGYGEEHSPFIDLSRLGGIVTKTLFVRPRRGNPPPRIVEVTGGMLNAIGLANVGFDEFVAKYLPRLRARSTVLIVSVGGEQAEEFGDIAAKFAGVDGVDGIEANVSCPNVKKGGLDIGTDPDAVFRVVRDVKAASTKPVWAKLTPNVTDVREIARAAEEAGADAISLINTISAMAIDWRSRSPLLQNNVGGYSGPVLKPIALRMIHEVRRACRIPVVGIGGITNATDALEFLVAGASAVQVGTANFVDPTVSVRIVDEMNRLLDEQGIAAARDVVGTLRLHEN
ncbi:MAG: dihydroorotate dehydrogenase [Planctomycetes bacterium]|nr:dihydroorotate dehydrogenase [Planctomycetota bacterium]